MQEILFGTPGNPVPENHFAGYFKSFDGLDIRYAVFRCEERVPRGTVLLLQGRNETIEKYFETIRDLTSMGLWVATFDWRGQAGSTRLVKAGNRGHVRRFEDFERDLDTFIETIILPDTKLPFFIVAHSMGALVALKAAPYMANRIERMVLLAPFIGSNGIGIPNGLLKTITNVLSLTGFGATALSRDVSLRPFEGNPVTSDQWRFERNRGIITAHPHLALGPPTARWIKGMIGAIETVMTMDHLTAITIPTLVLAPGQDALIPYASFEELSQKFRAAKLITIQGAQHELLQERDLFRDQALAAIRAFIPGSDADFALYASSF